MIDDIQKKQIIELLDARFRKLNKPFHCPMCGNTNFTLTDGYFSPVMQDDLNTFKLGGPSVPTVSIICNNCGFLSQHAMGMLGLLPKKEKPEEKAQPKPEESSETKGGAK